MKRFISITALILIIILFAACSDKGLNVERPDKISTADSVHMVPNIDENNVEQSPNVNGMRFNLTLYDFTSRYNAQKRLLGDADLIIMGNWRKNGDVTTDNNGVEIQYYYYDDYNITITATIEAVSEKLVNIGCGTTMSYFMSQSGDKNNSDIVLEKAAVLAVSACGFDSAEINTLQNIFYEISTEANNSIYYKGFVFSLSTEEDRSNSKNSIMLFRVFPISDSLKTEWNLTEYSRQKGK